MKQNEQSGFTLIEVMVTMVVFAIGILGIIHMQLNAVRTNGETRKYSEANNYLSQLAEQVGMAAFDDLTNTDGKQVLSPTNLNAWKSDPLHASVPDREFSKGSLSASRLVNKNVSGTLTVHFAMVWEEKGTSKTLFRNVVKSPDMEG